MPYIERAILNIPTTQSQWFKDISIIKKQLVKVKEQLNGDPLISKYEGATRTSLSDKLNLITSSLWSTTSYQTSTFERAYNEASINFGKVLASLALADKLIKNIEKSIEKEGAPYTPGRFPVWKKN